MNRTWINSALAEGATLTVRPVLVNRSILSAKVKWPGSKEASGLGHGLESALNNLELELDLSHDKEDAQ